ISTVGTASASMARGARSCACTDPEIHKEREMVIKARALGALLMACASAVGVSACGSSSSHSKSVSPATSAVTSPASTTTPSATTASTTTAASTSTTPATGAPIKLGMICSCSGPQAGSLGATSTVIQAWAKSVNTTGGINGHPVQV